jgi:hypothetical protein
LKFEDLIKKNHAEIYGTHFGAIKIKRQNFNHNAKIRLNGQVKKGAILIHPIIIPIIVALINEARVPAIKAETPNFESNTRLPGASAPMPPI